MSPSEEMSPNEEKQPSPGAASASDTPKKSRRKAKKQKKPFLRRVFKWAVVLVILCFVVRWVTLLVLPRLINSAFEKEGWTCTYERLELAFFSADIELWHVELAEKDSDAPAVKLEYARADLAVLKLFTGDIVARRLEVDGLDVVLERDAQGRIRLVGLDQPGKAEVAEEAPVEEEEEEEVADAERGPVDFTLPIQVNALRLQQVYLRWIDRAVEPNFDERLDVHVRVSDIGSEERPGRFEVLLTSPDVLESLRVEGTLVARGRQLDGKVDLRVRGLRPAAVEPYLRAAGLRAVAEELAFDARAEVLAEPIEADDVGVRAQVSLSDVSFRADEQPVIAIGSAGLEVARFDGGELNVSKVHLKKVLARADRTVDGNLLVAGLEFVPGLEAGGAPPAADEPSADGVAAKASVEDSAVGGVAADEAVVQKPAETTEPSTASSDSGGGAPRLQWHLDEFVVEDVVCSLRDASLEEPVELALHIDGLAARDIGPLQSRKGPTEWQLELASPGNFESLVLKGTAEYGAQMTELAFDLAMAQLDADRVRPYVEAAGWQPMLEAGTLRGKGRARLVTRSDRTLSIEAELLDLVYSDREELFRLGTVRLTQTEWQPAARRLTVGDLEISGSRSTITREASGQIRAFGLRSLPPSSSSPELVAAADSSSDTAAPARTASASQAAAPVADEQDAKKPDATSPEGEAASALIRKLAVRDHSLLFRDEMQDPPVEIELADLGIALTGLDTRAGSPPGRLRVWSKLDELVEMLELEGTLSAAGGDLEFDLTLAGRGLRAEKISPYLAEAGLESLLDAAALEGRLHAKVTSEDGATRVDAEIEALRFSDGEVEWAGIDAIRLVGLRSSAGELDIERVQITRPRARAERDADGLLLFAGLRTLPPEDGSETVAPDGEAVAESVSEDAAGSSNGVESAEESAVADGETESGDSEKPAEAFAFRLGELLIEEASVDWRDRAVEPAVQIVPSLRLSLTEFSTGGEKESGQLALDLVVPDALESFRLEGPLSVGRAQEIDWKLAARGLRTGALATYFPEGMTSTLEAGQLDARLRAEVGHAEEGGQRLLFEIADLNYRDGDARPLLSWDACRVDVPRLDIEGGRVQLEEVILAGVETRIETTADGASQLLGLRFEPAAPDPVTTVGDAEVRSASVEESAVGVTPLAARADSVAMGSTPDDGVRFEGKSPSSSADVAGTPGAEADGDPGKKEAAKKAPTPRLAMVEALPLVTLERLQVEVRRLDLVEAGAEKPIVVRELQLANAEPIRALGESPESEPPVQLALTGAVEPLVESLSAKLSAAPFAAQPEVELTVDVRGIRGTEIAAVRPALAESMRADELEDGLFRVRAKATADVRRRSPLDFSFKNGLGLEASVEGLEFRAKPEGELLAGLESAHLDVARYAPESGDVHVRSVEIDTPTFRARRDKEGFHMLGLTFPAPPPPPAAEDGEPSVEEAATEPEPAPVEESEVATAEKPATSGSTMYEGPDFRVDQILWSGFDLLFVDTTGSRPTAVPIQSFDLEVSQLSQKTLTEGKPFRFALNMEGGEVELPKRNNTGLVRGVFSDIAGLAVGEDVGAEELEARDFFEEISIAGKLALGPQQKGWAKASISALELGDFRGILEPYGVVLDDGVLDAGYTMRFQDGGQLDLTSSTTLGSLSLSEDENGPIYRYLKLPGPLDSILFLLRDSGGAITLPIDIELEPDNISTGAVALEGTKALGTVIGTAVAESGFRVAGGALDLVGIQLAQEPPPKSDRSVALDFSPGSNVLSIGERRKLAGLVELLESDDTIVLRLGHELGKGDLERAEVLANPSREDCLDLITNLGVRKRELERQVGEVQVHARAAWAVNDVTRAERLREQLESLNREAGLTEEALDELYDRLRPGSERRAPRRVRAAAVQLAALRLERVHRALLELDLADIESRIEKGGARFKLNEAGEPGRVLVTPKSVQAKVVVEE